MAQIASVVVPVYNEEDTVTRNSLILLEYLGNHLDDYELVLVENGSIDNTAEYAMLLSEANPHVKSINLPEANLGEAIRVGVEAACFDKIIYFPIDLSVNLSFIPESLRLLDFHEVVVGSKKLLKAGDQRPLRRRVASTGYHKAVQLFLKTDLSDTTCVKAYQRGAILELIDTIPSGSNVFETELLLEAQRMGLNIAEIPVTVYDYRKGRLPLGYKAASKGQDLLSLRLDLLSLIFGGILFFTGVLCIAYLAFQKLVFNRGGFLNPYSFLISMLLVLFGAQGIAYGLFARLFLQLRKEISQSNSRGSGNVFKEETE